MLQLYGTHEKIATQCEDLLFAIAISGWCTLNKCLSVHKNVNHFKNVLEDDVNSLYIFSILLLMECVRMITVIFPLLKYSPWSKCWLLDTCYSPVSR